MFGRETFGIHCDVGSPRGGIEFRMEVGGIMAEAGGGSEVWNGMEAEEPNGIEGGIEAPKGIEGGGPLKDAPIGGMDPKLLDATGGVNEQGRGGMDPPNGWLGGGV
uniref:Uncharacterized protein n=1 Tax=Noctiluca scintillans TaxID=2966 RepID=A0A6T9FNR4_NOCSC|mmetsp:Transcript_58169/g.154922  ORF Transcript_58169/g.154922 Transcript_58169/m.154922 type:complete len:106 (+) Transcript_58169:260-577(+)